MKNIWSKVIVAIFSITVMATAMTGCIGNDKGDADESSNTQIDFQIGEDISVTPVVANKPFNEMSDDEIDSISRDIFKQASIVFENLYFSADLIELDDEVSIMQDDTTWYKVKHINTWDDFCKIWQSIYSKAFFEDTILQTAKNQLIEDEGILYQSPERIGGMGGYGRLVPTEQKIVAVIKEPNKMVIRASMQGVKQGNTNDESEDGVLDYTIIVEDGNCVLDNFYGTEGN